jgi:RNA polymerase sigma-70 factor, ECF subfamily
MSPRLNKDEQMSKKMSDACTDYSKDLNKHSFFKVNNLALSQDLVQDTFAKTWSYLVKGGEIDLMRAFLYHTLNCLIIDEYRKRKGVSLESLVEKGFEPGVLDTEEMINKLDGKTAFLLIGQLPDKYQKIIRMRFAQNLTLAEMALITGQSKNAMAVQVHRGLEKLKVLYSHSEQID